MQLTPRGFAAMQDRGKGERVVAAAGSFLVLLSLGTLRGVGSPYPGEPPPPVHSDADNPDRRTCALSYRQTPESPLRVHGDDAHRDTIVLRPGDRTVDGTRIAPYEVVWVQYFEKDGRRTLRRTIVDRVERAGASDPEQLVRTQTFLALDGTMTSEHVNHVERSTLAPVRERWRFDERLTQVDYEGARVSGAMIGRVAGPSTVVFDERLEEHAFDFNIGPLVLAAIRLETSLVLRFPHVRISPPAFSVPELVWAVFRVEGREAIDAGPLGAVEAWRVVDPQHDMVFWLIGESPHLVRVEFLIDESTLSVLELGTASDSASER